ncbi:MAG: tRNA preQ1(34) S-adenosylmethionine ribosyltransferase-isomerase QueA [Planctomycetota bacterium]|nr:tRNA preQ1(34) S-adenosylmethionine ribosyltransferase-isomerase QueA [Planctomycetota bacterium]
MSDADEYDYALPEVLIAQQPLPRRSDARLLHVRRADSELRHRHVRDLPTMLRRGDLVVVNDTRVVPARLVGHREATGGKWEGLFLSADTEAGTWQILAQTRGRPAIGERIVLHQRPDERTYPAREDRPARHRDLRDADAGETGCPVVLQLLARGSGGTWIVRPTVPGPAPVLLDRVGRVPLPGYIRGGAEEEGDRDRYQTVFARAAGSAAAPTAGLHFTDELLAGLTDRGIGLARVTLHVGIDTFRPLSTDRLDDHVMHTEWCECPAETVAAIAEAKARGGRVVAIGTTAVRTLETAAQRSASGTLSAWRGPTELFIKPGFSFRVVDCLLTNFHMPRTTLMVLVSAFASRDLIRRAYDEAICERYRFLSYGDAMLIE